MLKNLPDYGLWPPMNADKSFVLHHLSYISVDRCSSSAIIVQAQPAPAGNVTHPVNNNLDKAHFALTRRPGRFETQALGLHRSVLEQLANRRAHLCRFCRGALPS
jgi:hypothetical protein